MKNWAIFILLVGSACAQTAQPYDIKGNGLGMTIEDFKKKYYSFERGDKKHPDKTGPRCTASADAFLFLSEEEARAGVISCYPGFNVYLPGAPLVNRVTHAVPETLANIQLNGIAYQFFEGKLFRVVATFNAEDYPAMKDAFISKFGSPVKTDSYTVENRNGASLAGEIVIWVNGISGIDMRSRSALPENGIVVITLPDVNDKVQGLKPKKPNDL